ncbi:peptidase C26 [Paenibacillus sp. J31TS4]|uniref:gamma-glutamyl-gamma-aminobutyrate hydrolase family protein n=1 Tax=Paenibacillus sp. J31TS4 TaxID=2807195 RepID=UPI001B1949E3|nr:gamma-glutamyl-gamma-aminobutyrate hydrolase family protein [Paenibacillus sp. J31TS4]GIP37211.1 peptidase C26 [Paenibacillus sp. J31TS4]
MKPIIGVTASCEPETAQLKHTYAQSVSRAGGIPFTLPYLDERADLERIVDQIDGLLLTGGPDLDPIYFGEEPLRGLGRVTPARDRLEMALTPLVIERGKPVLAICRGVQVLNVAMGGSLYQDLLTQLQTIQHTQQAPASHPSHSIRLAEGTLLTRLAGASMRRVNSFHHQAVARVAPGFVVSATASDGVIEAIESTSHAYVIGVQWHPEEMSLTDPFAGELFASFVAACRTASPDRGLGQAAAGAPY